MITENNIKLNDSRTLSKQIEDLSEGFYYLMNASKWESIRLNNQEKYYSGKIGAKEFAEKQRLLIRNVLSDIEKNTIYSSTDELPF